MIRKYGTRREARTALTNDGYAISFSSPGRPELWHRDRYSRCAIARVMHDGEESWRIMAYPEPAVCSPEDVKMYARRDGVVLRAGQYVDDGAWLE